MSAAIRELCLLAVLCAAVTSICPEGNVKKICSLTCSIGAQAAGRLRL